MLNPLDFNDEPTPQYVYMQDLPGSVKTYWQHYWEELGICSSSADIDQLTNNFMSQLGDVSGNRFAYQITPLPLDNPDIPVPYNIWQSSWASFLEEPTAERQSLLKEKLLDELAELTDHDMGKFIYNEFAIKTELCIHFLEFAARKKTILSQTTSVNTDDTSRIEGAGQPKRSQMRAAKSPVMQVTPTQMTPPLLEPQTASSTSTKQQYSGLGYREHDVPDIDFVFGSEPGAYHFDFYRPADQHSRAEYQSNVGVENELSIQQCYQNADTLDDFVALDLQAHDPEGYDKWFASLTMEQQEALNMATAIRASLDISRGM